MQDFHPQDTVGNDSAGTHGHTLDLKQLRLIDAEAEALGVAELQRRLWDAAKEIERLRQVADPERLRRAATAIRNFMAQTSQEWVQWVPADLEFRADLAEGKRS